MKLILALLVTVQMCFADLNRAVSITEPNLQYEATSGYRLTKNESLVVTDDYITDGTPMEWATLCLQYLKLVYIAVGFISNGFVFAIFYRRNRTKAASANIYLMALSLSDALACLIINVFAFGARYSWNVSVYRGTDCILSPFLIAELPPILSNLIIMVLCFERCIAIFAPMRSQTWLTVARARAMLGFMVLLVAVVNWPSFGGYTAFTQEDIDNDYPALDNMFRYCKARFPLVAAYSRGWQKVQGTFLFIVLPIVSAVFCNCLIAGKVCLKTRMVTRSSLGQSKKPKTEQRNHKQPMPDSKIQERDTIYSSVSSGNISSGNNVSIAQEGNSHPPREGNQPTMFPTGKPSPSEGSTDSLSSSSSSPSFYISAQNMSAPDADEAEDDGQMFTIKDKIESSTSRVSSLEKVDSSGSNEPSLDKVDSSTSNQLSQDKVVDPGRNDQPAITLQSTSLSRHHSYITRVCLVVSTELIVFTAALFLASLFAGPRVIEDPEALAGAAGPWSVGLAEALHLLLSLHHSASNLALYTVFVPTFRRDLKNLCC